MSSWFGPKRKWTWMPRLLVHDAHIGVLDHRCPLADLGLDIGIKLIRRAAANGHAEIGEALLHLVLCHQPRDLGVESLHDVPWRARRRNQRKPGCGLEAGQ